MVGIDAAAAAIRAGDHVAFGGGGALMRRPMALVRELVRGRARDLHVHHILGGIEIDVLIGAGAVASTNCSYVGLLEHGQAPCFQRAARSGEVTVREYSEYLLVAGLRAAVQGLPFMPFTGAPDSDIVEGLALRMVEDPYTGRRLLAVPAARLDVAVIHVERADEDGYVERPDVPDAVWDYDHLIARVARTTIVCAEEVVPRADPARVGVIGREITAVVHTPRGAWPTGLHPRYAPDVAHVRDEYLPAAREGGAALQAYLDAFALA